MFRDLIDRARLALGDLWRREPARVVGAVVAVLTAAGVTVTTANVAAVLAVVVPILLGTETVRRQVYARKTVEDADREAGLPPV